MPNLWNEIDEIKEQMEKNNKGDKMSSDTETKFKDMLFSINVVRNDIKMLKQFLKTAEVDQIANIIE